MFLFIQKAHTPIHPDTTFRRTPPTRRLRRRLPVASPQELEAVAQAMQPGEVSDVLGTEARGEESREELSTSQLCSMMATWMKLGVCFVRLNGIISMFVL